MNHVIVNYNLLGDSLMTTPAVKAYKSLIPKEDKITVVVNDQEFQRVYENNPYVDHLIYVNEEQKNILVSKYTRSEPKDPFQGRGKWVKINESEKGIIIDITKAFDWCTKNPKVVKVFKNGFEAVSIKVPHFAYGIAKQLGVTIENTHYVLNLTDDEIKLGKDYVSKFEKPLVVCAALSKSCTSRHDKNHPGEKSKPANKMIPESVWAKVLENLKEKFDFVFVAADGEELLDLDVRWEVGRPIREVAAICKAARAVVSIDTGIGHVAQAVDANIVSICAAVARSLTSVEETGGKYYCVDRTIENPFLEHGILKVTPEEIIDGINYVT